MITHRADLWQIVNTKLPAAEIGCAEGYFAADILSWGVPKLFMVDNWDTIPNQKGDGGNTKAWHQKNMDAALERVKKYGDKAVILRGFSVLMAHHVPNDSLGFVNIDCDHSYEGVKADIAAWWPKLAHGGIMAFHDYEMQHYGVKQAVKEFAASNRLEIHLLPENKMEDAGAYLINL